MTIDEVAQLALGWRFQPRYLGIVFVPEAKTIEQARVIVYTRLARHANN